MRITKWIKIGILIVAVVCFAAALIIQLSGADIPHDAVGGLHHFTAGMQTLLLIAVGVVLLIADGIWMLISLILKKSVTHGKKEM